VSQAESVTSFVLHRSRFEASSAVRIPFSILHARTVEIRARQGDTRNIEIVNRCGGSVDDRFDESLKRSFADPHFLEAAYGPAVILGRGARVEVVTGVLAAGIEEAGNIVGSREVGGCTQPGK
jgi:hypothetical protein